jgi:hypothetical protein
MNSRKSKYAMSIIEPKLRDERKVFIFISNVYRKKEFATSVSNILYWHELVELEETDDYWCVVEQLVCEYLINGRCGGVL